MSVLGMADVVLGTFSGINTETTPPDIPQGVSPDCEDVSFLPGSVSSRPCLHKFFATAVPSSVTVTYQKTYVQRDGTILTLFLTSDGKLWKEDVTNTPGTYSQIAQVTPGCYAQSVTENGREYIAFSDLEFGSDIPRQYDGTNLDRVSQDGPGACATLTNFSPAAATVSNSGAGAAIAITTVVASDSVTTTTITKYGGEINHTYFTTLTYNCSAAHGLSVGSIVVITGMTPSTYNRTSAVVTAIPNSTTFKIAIGSGPTTGGVGGTVNVQSPSIVIASNIATATTAAAHSFVPGWQVQITGIANASVATIAAAAGSAARVAGVSTITTTVAHGLPVGMKVAISGVTDTTFNGTFVIASVPSTTTFTYIQSSVADASSANGAVSLIWSDTFVITSVPTTTTFTYAQIAPDSITSSSGTATIIGRVVAGQHNVVLLFQTRTGYITAPCPPIQFTANGNSLILASNIPIGPSNVIARVFAFCGVGGDNYFFIPVQPIINGVVQGTATVVFDNTSTSAIFDFSDNTLFAALAIDTPGNNLFEQVVLGPCLGVGAYASRTFWWGERNKVQNFLNMGFDGGYLPTAPTLPLGWTNDTAGGALNSSSVDYGFAWQITGDGTANPLGRIYQAAYADAFTVAILQPSTAYTFRCWAVQVGSTGSLIAEIYSPTSGVLATATIAISGISATGGFVQANFNASTPATIPSDTVLRIYAQNQNLGDTLTFDECEAIYTINPYLNNVARASYVVNPEAFDGVTGLIGPSSDPSPIRCMTVLRNTLLIKTAKRVHETQDSPLGEPATWAVNQVSGSVGAISLRASDIGSDSTGEGGLEWDITATRAGLFIYAGGEFSKISQEIQSIWEEINWVAQKTIWTKIDNVTRRLYVGVPTGEFSSPNRLLVMDFRGLDTAVEIAAEANVHVTMMGVMKVRDMTRKWTKWNVQAHTGEIITRSGHDVEFCVGSGNGLAPGNGTGFGNIYYFDPAKYTDDDYGAIVPYYITYFFLDDDQESQMQIGLHRNVFGYLSAFISGTGKVSVIPLVGSIANAWTATLQYTMSQSQFYDFEWSLNVVGERVAFKVVPVPLANTTDVQFSLQRMTVALKPDPFAPVRGRI